MSACTEKLPSHTRSNWRKTRKSIKRQTAKTLRRLSRKHGMDAPSSVIKGWAD